MFQSHPVGTCPISSECGLRIRNTGVQEGSLFREETEGGYAELLQDPGHHVVKLTLLKMSLSVINKELFHYPVVSKGEGIFSNLSTPQTIINCLKL